MSSDDSVEKISKQKLFNRFFRFRRKVSETFLNNELEVEQKTTITDFFRSFRSLD